MSIRFSPADRPRLASRPLDCGLPQRSGADPLMPVARALYSAATRRNSPRTSSWSVIAMFVSGRVAIFSGAGRVDSSHADGARRAGRATAEDCE